MNLKSIPGLTPGYLGLRLALSTLTTHRNPNLMNSTMNAASIAKRK